MKTFIDWLLLVCFAIALFIWAPFAVAENLLLQLLNKLEKVIDTRFLQEKPNL